MTSNEALVNKARLEISSIVASLKKDNINLISVKIINGKPILTYEDINEV